MDCDGVRPSVETFPQSRSSGKLDAGKPYYTSRLGFFVEEYLPVLQELLLCFLTSRDIDCFPTCFFPSSPVCHRRVPAAEG